MLDPCQASSVVCLTADGNRYPQARCSRKQVFSNPIEYRLPAESGFSTHPRRIRCEVIACPASRARLPKPHSCLACRHSPRARHHYPPTSARFSNPGEIMRIADMLLVAALLCVVATCSQTVRGQITHIPLGTPSAGRDTTYQPRYDPQILYHKHHSGREITICVSWYLPSRVCSRLAHASAVQVNPAAKDTYSF